MVKSPLHTVKDGMQGALRGLISPQARKGYSSG